MTIDEAIKLLGVAVQGFPAGDAEKYFKAMELGIEALKRVKDMRISPCTTSDEILPGETEE